MHGVCLKDGLVSESSTTTRVALTWNRIAKTVVQHHPFVMPVEKEENMIARIWLAEAQTRAKHRPNTPSLALKPHNISVGSRRL